MAAGKRVQVMLRPEIWEIVEELRDEDNLSDSKICAILIEQALVNRALWDKKTRQRLPADTGSDPASKSLNKTDILEGIELPEGVTVQTTTKHQQPETEEQELMEIAKKLRLLKQLEMI